MGEYTYVRMNDVRDERCVIKCMHISWLHSVALKGVEFQRFSPSISRQSNQYNWNSTKAKLPPHKHTIVHLYYTVYCAVRLDNRYISTMFSSNSLHCINTIFLSNYILRTVPWILAMCAHAHLYTGKNNRNINSNTINSLSSVLSVFIVQF